MRDEERTTPLVWKSVMRPSAMDMLQKVPSDVSSCCSDTNTFSKTSLLPALRRRVDGNAELGTGLLRSSSDPEADEKEREHEGAGRAAHLESRWACRSRFDHRKSRRGARRSGKSLSDGEDR